MLLTSTDDINQAHRHIFIGAHFDDVIYSCGGTIATLADKGERVLSITVFASAPDPGIPLTDLAFGIHDIMGFDKTVPAQEIVRVRRGEDANAFNHLGSDYLWLEYFDAPYRNLAPSYREQEIHPADEWIVERLAKQLLAIHERFPETIWYAPMSIGRHADHRLVRAATDHLAQNGAKIYFFEDFPYVLRENALTQRIKELNKPFEPTLVVDVTNTLERRIVASDLYLSQTKMNFGTQGRISSTNREYTASVAPNESGHHERYWSYKV